MNGQMKTRLLMAFIFGVHVHVTVSLFCPRKISCASIQSDNGGFIQYVAKSIPSNAVLRAPLATAIDQPERIKMFRCVKPACLSSPCMHNSTCTETDQGFNCSCLSGYRGRRCEYEEFIQSVHLLGGHGHGGRVAFTTRSSPTSLILTHLDGLTSERSHLICLYMGFNGTGETVDGNTFDSSTRDIYATVRGIGCPLNASSITDCWLHNKTDGGGEVAGVECY